MFHFSRVARALRCYSPPMRNIGTLPTENNAKTLSGVLYVRGIETDIENEDDGTFSIWVHDDDHIAEATATLARFRVNPDDAEFSTAVREADAKRSRQEKEDARRASNVITRERIEYERNFSAFAWLPMLLAIISVAVTLWAGELEFMPSAWTPQGQGTDNSEQAIAARKLFERRNMIAMTEWREPTNIEDNLELSRDLLEGGGTFTRKVRRHFYDITLPEVRHGQVWRLFASIFLHFGILHIVFNLMWLRDLGGFIQHRFGAGYLAVLVLLTAIVSNYAQLWRDGPGAGGLSGVNYGLFGYLWMRGKFDRTGLWKLNPQTVQLMMIWLVVCYTGALGPIANTAHTAGLIFGMAAGFIVAKWNTRKRGR